MFKASPLYSLFFATGCSRELLASIPNFFDIFTLLTWHGGFKLGVERKTSMCSHTENCFSEEIHALLSLNFHAPYFYICIVELTMTSKGHETFFKTSYHSLDGMDP